MSSLSLPERRFLKRLTGRRRQIRLEISGYLWVPRAGSHGFELSCDDACSLSIDGKTVIQGAGSLSAEIQLQEGFYPLLLRYEQAGGPAVLRLNWNRPVFVELLPLESYVSGQVEDLEKHTSERSDVGAWFRFFLHSAWLLAVAYLLVRAGESRRSWLDRFVGFVHSWLTQPETERDTALVRPRPWLGAAVLFAVSALCAWALAPRAMATARIWYSVNPLRMQVVLERLKTYPVFLLSSALICLAVSAVLGLLATTRWGSLATISNRLALWLTWTAVAVTLAWGMGVSEREWARFERPCYDQYCDYALLVREVLQEPSASSWSALRRHLAANYHANSPVGPVLVAVVGMLVSDIVVAHRLVSALATLASLALLLRIGREHLGLGHLPAAVAAFLFSALGPVQRSFLFPQTDALAMFLFTLAAERLLALRRGFTPVAYVTAVLVMTLAMFSKLSALPILGVAAVVLAWPSAGENAVSRKAQRKGYLRVLAGAARRSTKVALVVLPPGLLMVLFIASLGTTDNLSLEILRIDTLDSRVSLHLIAALVTLLPLFLALVLTIRKRWTETQVLVLASIAVYLAGLWLSGASGWERFYLNAVPMAIPLAVARLAPLPGMTHRVHVGVLCSAYAVAHAVRMSLNLYTGA